MSTLATTPAAIPAVVPPRLRALFVSDLHLGYKGADIRALNTLLSACEVDQLYLVGDILDGWKLEKRWHWTQAYCELFDTLMAMRRRRVRITLITGNHDEKLREIVPKLMRPLILRRFGIRIEERCTHRTAGGKRLLVTHGDQFDGMLWRGGSKAADRLWGLLTEIGLARPPRTDRRWSLGRAIAREGGGLAERYVNAAFRRVLREGADGIVFGHSHVPLLDRRDGRWLANCGGWTRASNGTHTAIAETLDGRLELLHWPATPTASIPSDEPGLRVQDSDAARLIRYIHALWRPGDPAVRRLPHARPSISMGPRPATPPAPLMAATRPAA